MINTTEDDIKMLLSDKLKDLLELLTGTKYQSQNKRLHLGLHLECRPPLAEGLPGPPVRGRSWALGQDGERLETEKVLIGVAELQGGGEGAEVLLRVLRQDGEGGVCLSRGRVRKERKLKISDVLF